jgi:hypothetical protein
MGDTKRFCCCLLGTWCVAAMALAQGPGAPASPRVVVPEPVVEPSPAVAVPVSEEPTPMLPQIKSSAHGPTGCRQQQGCCPNDACPGRRHGRLFRLKLRLQESYWGYPEEFCELPLGARLYAHLNTQVANGMAAQMVLYRYDFCDGIWNDAAKLNQHGRKRLKQMVRMLQCDLHPILVEDIPEEPGLSAARRDHVLKSIAELGFTVPEEWVVVGEPQSAGLSGEEAIIVYQQMLAPPPPSSSGEGPGMGALQNVLGESTQYPSMSPSGGGGTGGP